MAALVASVSLACAGKDGGMRANNADGLRASLRVSTAAVIASDAANVYQGYAKACRESTRYQSFASAFAATQASSQDLYGAKPSDLKVSSIVLGPVAAGKGLAQVVYVSKNDPAIVIGASTWTQYVYEDGDWRNAVCDAMPLGPNAAQPSN
jgi:hypothetical protein